MGVQRRHLTTARSQAWDSLHLDHIAWLIDAYGVNVVVDAGANMGQFGSSLRAIGYRGLIFSFEPVQRCAVHLAELTATDPSWMFFPYALGRHDSTVLMNVSSGTGSSVLTPNEYGMNAFEDLRVWTVQEALVRRLDTALADWVDEDARILLKMDTQGYDLEVFAGAGALLPRIAAIQSEVSLLPIYDGMPAMAEALLKYSVAGFHISGMFPVTVELRTGRVLEFDCILVRPERTLVADAGLEVGPRAISTSLADMRPSRNGPS